MDLYPKKIIDGLTYLVENGRRHPDIMLHKVDAMFEHYLAHNPDLYKHQEIEQLRYYLRGVAYKFHLAYLSLEQLWALSEYTRSDLYDAIKNSFQDVFRV